MLGTLTVAFGAVVAVAGLVQTVLNIVNQKYAIEDHREKSHLIEYPTPDQTLKFGRQAGERLRDRYGDVADQARDRFDQAQDLVRHNPTQSVLAAFGVGFVAGVIVGLALTSRP